MIRTATAALKAALGFWPVPSQTPERGQRENDDHGDEDRADPVGQPLDLRLAVLRIGDEPAYLRQLGVGPDAGGPDQQPAACVDGGTGDIVAGGHLDRDALAGQQARVDSAAALLDLAVGSDLLTGTDDEKVTDSEVLDRNPDLLAVPQHGHVLGPELQQGLQRRSGAPLGARLEVPPGEQEDRHDRGHLEVDLVVR